jgi:hypothetical protein
MEKEPGRMVLAVDRDELIDFIVESYDAATDTWSAWDLSDASLSVVWRLYKTRPDEADVEETLTKVDSGTGGRVRKVGAADGRAPLRGDRGRRRGRVGHELGDAVGEEGSPRPLARRRRGRDGNADAGAVGEDTS